MTASTGFSYSFGTHLGVAVKGRRMYSAREVFSESPLELVAGEIKYTHAPKLRKSSTIDSLVGTLQDSFPLLEKDQKTTVTLSRGGALASEETEELPRLLNQARTWSVTVAPDSLTVETTRYTQFPDFKKRLLEVAAAVGQLGSVGALTRVGLRYINEIRVPSIIKDVRDWQEWVNPQLLGVVSVANNRYPATHYQGLVKYAIGENSNLILRFAALEGAGVVGTKPLRRRSKANPGHYFVLDMDCSFLIDAEDSRDFDVHDIANVLDQLHAPHGEVFQASITDRLREVFRGKM